MIVPQNNWLRVVFTLRGSAVLRIWPRLSLTIAVAVAITALHVWGIFTVSLTPLPFTLVGVALGIFLGFRNNTSYDRYWEARKLWGRLVNASRSLTRQLLTMVDDPSGDAGEATRGEGPSELQRELIYQLIAYVHALRLHLRDDKDLEELAPFLSPSRLDALAGEINRPVALLQWLGDALTGARRSGRVHPYHAGLLENSLSELTSIQGACERIKSTPIPFSYNVLMHRIVGFYCVSLPLGIVDSVGILTPVVVGGVAYAFFGLDAIGDEIEEPFGLDPNDLPLATLSRMIEVNLRQRLGEADLPPLMQPVNRVLS